MRKSSFIRGIHCSKFGILQCIGLMAKDKIDELD